MTTEQATCVCCHCKKPVAYHVQKINHLKQFGLALATLGLWVPMWLLCSLVRVKICDECGKPAEPAK